LDYVFHGVRALRYYTVLLYTVHTFAPCRRDKVESEFIIANTLFRKMSHFKVNCTFYFGIWC